MREWVRMTTQAVAPGACDVVAGLLGAGFNGAVRLPGEAEYDVQRKSVIPTVDSRPLVVAEAYSRTDVQAAVRTAREYGVPIAVQATGHGTRVPADGGILLKTTPMTSVLVDPERRIAKVAPGARWGAVLDAAGQFGLAPLSGSHRDVGVTGYTLGGGVGWLARKYGFAADSVIRAEVVTADGRLVTASAEHHADLFWAIRGGTGNFGIVTSLEFRLYPVRQVHAGIVYYGIDRSGRDPAPLPRLDRHDPQRAQHRGPPDPGPRHRTARRRDQGPVRRCRRTGRAPAEATVRGRRSPAGRRADHDRVRRSRDGRHTRPAPRLPRHPDRRRDRRGHRLRRRGRADRRDQALGWRDGAPGSRRGTGRSPGSVVLADRGPRDARPATGLGSHLRELPR